VHPELAELHRRFGLIVHYDGTYFLGWQLQAMGRTVQGEMEFALERLTGERRRVTAAGRTDTGVHASGQLAAVTVPSRWSRDELHRALNATLPDDIWVESVHPVPLDFNPRYAARSRSYRYQVGLREDAYSPFHRPWCWPIGRRLDRGLLDRCARLLPGTHSFRAFAKAGQEWRGYQCRVEEAEWVDWARGGAAFHVTADRFLHHMVRYLVGTMVDVARGRRALEDLEELLSEEDTKLTTSPPAPPEGLFLVRVHYTQDDLELD
jgi:tRNA pseudouridine38-40 synthase